jgi:hypothetical protein
MIFGSALGDPRRVALPYIYISGCNHMKVKSLGHTRVMCVYRNAFHPFLEVIHNLGSIPSPQTKLLDDIVISSRLLLSMPNGRGNDFVICNGIKNWSSVCWIIKVGVDLLGKRSAQKSTLDGLSSLGQWIAILRSKTTEPFIMRSEVAGGCL